MTFGVMIRRHHVKHRLPGRPQGTNNSQSRVDHVARRVNSASPEVSPPTHHLITWNSGAISEGATPFTHPHLCAFPQGPPCSSILSKFQLSSRLSSNVTSSAKATPTHAKMNTPSSLPLPRAGLVSGVALFFTTCLHSQVKHSMRCYTLVICWGFPVLSTLSQTESALKKRHIE